MRLERPLRSLFAALVVLALPAFVAAQQRTPTSAPSVDEKAEKAADKDKEKDKERKADEKPPKEEKPSVTHHEIRAGGTAIRYTATAGYMPMKDENGKLKANIFYMAYTKDGVPAGRRPITFTFNGGPGSSSVWLHLGAIGPRRVVMGDNGEPLPPPYRLVDNEYSWLAWTDLVFIDPVTTGYSRPAVGEKPEQFHGVQEDIESVGEFIRLYTTRYARWSSPKFLAGESYGTTRAAGLSGYLQDRFGMYLNGIVLISTILNFQTTDFNVGNDLPYVLFLPSYTSTAWYHKKLPADLQSGPLAKAVAESEKFAASEYDLALMRGSELPAAERQAVVKKLSRLTGLSEKFIESNDLRVPLFRFTKELLRDDRRTVGRLDSRFQGIDRDAAGERFDFDPSYAAIYGTYTAMINDYVRTELKYENDLPYEILTGRVRPWNYGTAQNRYVNVADTLRGAISQNRDLKVFVAEGYYDFATPYFAAEYTFNHLGLDPTLYKNIRHERYESGHMVYIHKASLVKMTADIASFYQSALPQ